jgi:hypothetical protein
MRPLEGGSPSPAYDAGMSEDAGYDDAVLPEQTADDTDLGWGEHPDESDDVERLLREKPPHW